MKQFSRTIRIALCFFILIFFSCKKESVQVQTETDAPTEITAAPAANTSAINFLPDFSTLANNLENRLKGNVVGYSFVISYRNLNVASRSGGFARMSQNAPSRNMSINDKYSTASVSKTITAAALLKTLSTLPNTFNMIDQPMWTYLPKHWTFGPNIKTITFRELLNHTSGFRNGANDGNSCNYFQLKTLVANGIMLSNKTTSSYNNRNYALMRLLIPKLAKYNIPDVDPSDPIFLPWEEGVQAVKYSNAYISYCNQVIFKNVPSTSNISVGCVNNDANPALYYPFPTLGATGVMQGDLSSSSGGQGWVLTTAQMADFFRTLHYTEKILPNLLTQLMVQELYGYDVKGTTADGVSFYWKNGIYNLTGPCYRSLIIGFGDDVQISIMTNSALNLQNAAIAAHEDWSL